MDHVSLSDGPEGKSGLLSGVERLPLWLRVVLFAAAYFGLAVLGDLFSFKPNSFTTFWLPSGLFVAALLLSETRHWPLLVLAAYPANIGFDLYTHKPLQLSLLFCTGNCLEALVGALLVRRFVANRPDFTTLRQVAGFTVLAAVLGPVFSATMGTTILNYRYGAPYLSTWATWWSSDAMGILVMSPMLLVPLRSFAKRFRYRAFAEAMALTTLLAIVTTFAFVEQWYLTVALKYTVVPFLLWAAIRFGPHGAAGCMVVIALVSNAMLAGWLGLVAKGEPATHMDVIELQFYLAILGFCGLAVAALFAERRRAEQSIRESREQFQAMMEGTTDAVYIKDPQGRYQLFNSGAERVVGRRSAEVLGKDDTLIFPAQEARAVMDGDRQVMAGGKTVTYEEVVTTAQGVLQTFISTKGPLRDAEGNVVGLFGIARDITARKRAEEELRNRERLLAETQRIAHVGSWTVSTDWKETHWSDETYNIFGVDAAKVAPSPEVFFGLIHEGDKPAMMQWLQECMAGSNPPALEFRIVRPDGAERVLFGHGYIDVESNPKRPCIVGSVQDITARKQAERELRAAKAYAENLIATANAIVVGLDVQGNVTVFNQAAEEVTGYRREDLVGKNWFEVLVPRDRYPQVWEEFSRLMEGGLPRNFENPILTRDGQERHIVWQNSEVCEGGKVVGVVSFGLDVTEQRRAEAGRRAAQAELERFFTLIPDLVCVASPDGHFTKLNPAWETTLGYPLDVLARTPFIEFIHPDDVERTLREVQSQLAGKATAEFVNRYRHKDGTCRWMEWNATAAVDGQFFAVARDITRRKEMEEKLAASETRYSSLFQNMSEGVAYCRMIYEDGKPIDFVYLAVNEAFEKQTGLKDVVGKRVTEVIPGIRDLDPELFVRYGGVASTGQSCRFERHLEALREWFDLSVYCPHPGHFVAVFDVITARKQAEERQRLTVEVLQLLNESGELSEAVDIVLGAIRASQGCDAVGLRLRNAQGDFPYYGHSGFGEEFVRLENSLLRSEDGKLVCDSTGQPALECTCGLVLSGKTDPSQPFFTPGGSFWSNHTSALLGLSAEQDPRTNPRNRCISEGYESVALVPLRVGKDIVGLLQLNYRKPGAFTLEAVEFYEGLGASIGIALERKQAKDALLEAAQLNQQVINSAQEGVVVYGPDLRYQVWNPFMEELSGKKAYEVLGKHPMEVFPFLREAGVIERLEQALAGQTPDTVDFPYDLPAIGRKGWTSDRSDPLRDVQGKIIGVIATVRDITHRKEAEEKLRESERRFRTVFEQAGVGVAQIDSWTGRFVHVNKRYADILGYTQQEVLGITFQQITHPDDLHADLGQMAALREGRIREFSMAKRYYHKNGNVVWVNLTVSPMWGAGEEPRYHIAIVEDITNRKEAEEKLRDSEERFRRMAESMDSVFWISSADFSKMMYVSPAYEKIWGRSTDSLHENPRSFMEAIHPDDRERVANAVRPSGPDQTGEFDIEYRIVRPDGSVRTIHDRGSPVHDETGRLLYVVGIADDITERRQLEEQLLHSQKMEAIGRLAGGIAHDFRNQLTVIKGYAEMLLQRTPSDSSGHDMLDEILKAANRSTLHTGRLLAFSRKDILQSQAVNLSDLVADICKTIPRVISEDVRVWVQPSTEDLHVMIDPGQFQQAMVNLAVNARDAMPHGGLLTITTRRVAPQEAQTHPELKRAHCAAVIVTDTGHGMDEQTMAKIFEPFFTTKPVGQGTGLGLAMVYGFVKQSGGAIDVQSEVGKGTTFRLLLPLVEEAAESAAMGDHPAAVRGGAETVLLVEDDAPVRALVRMFLESSGYTVLPAGSVAEALSIAQREHARISLLLTDIIMPGGSGPELAERFAKAYPHVPVVMLSGYPADELSARGITPEEARLLIKPFTQEALVTKVRQAIESVRPTG